MSTATADTIVTMQDETQVSLSSFWQELPLVLVFLRHFG